MRIKTISIHIELGFLGFFFLLKTLLYLLFHIYDAEIHSPSGQEGLEKVMRVF